MEEDKDVIEIDGDSSSSDSDSGSGEEEEEAANSSELGNGESSNDGSRPQSEEDSEDEVGAGSPAGVGSSPGPSSVGNKGRQDDFDEEISSVIAATSQQAIQFLQDSDVEEEKEDSQIQTSAKQGAIQDIFGADSDSDEEAMAPGPSSLNKRRLSSEGDDESSDGDEEERALPAKKPRIEDDDEEEEEKAASGDEYSERLEVEDVSEDEEEEKIVTPEKEEEEEEEDSVLEAVTEDAAADDISGKQGKEGSDEEVAEEGESEGEKEEEEEDEAQLQVEVAELGGEEEAGGEEDEEGQERDQQDNAEDSDDEPVEDDRKGFEGMSDWDLMMQRRKAAMDRNRRRRRCDGDITLHDDAVMELIQKMRDAAEQDRQLNMARKAATKKIQFLPTIMSYIKRATLQTIFIECGILSAFAEWLSPLPDHSLPHLKIRDTILDTLRMFPAPDSAILKSSKIGKSVMLLYQHPKETRKNREKAGKLINEWARPIFGLASDFKMITREEREKQDYANLSQEARRRISTGERRKSQDDDPEQPQKPGDKGWIGRARVPMPSTKGYVVRPKWNVEQEYHKKGSTKKSLNRYEKHLRKKKQEHMQKGSAHAMSISVEGRHMPL